MKKVVISMGKQDLQRCIAITLFCLFIAFFILPPASGLKSDYNPLNDEFPCDYFTCFFTRQDGRTGIIESPGPGEDQD